MQLSPAPIHSVKYWHSGLRSSHRLDFQSFCHRGQAFIHDHTHSLACALRHTPHTLPCTLRHVWVYTHNPLHVRCPRTIFQNTTTWDLKTLLSSSPNFGEAYCRARQRELHGQGGVPRTHRAHVRDMAERLRSGAHQLYCDSTYANEYNSPFKKVRHMKVCKFPGPWVSELQERKS